MRACPEAPYQLSLRQFLPEAELRGAEDIQVASCSCDSRTLRRGALFAALPGSLHDGRQFVAEAVERGCSAILVDRPVEDAPVPQCIVTDVRGTYGRICQALAGDPSRHLKVIAVTGTNGKTTTGVLIARMLAKAGRRTALSGTLGYFDGEDCEDATLTTPPPDQLAAWLARSVANGCSHAVLEVSSHALDQKRLAGVVLDAACVTNVRRDHLDYHRTIDDYRVAKSRIFDYLSGDGFVVINADDLACAAYLNNLEGPVLTVALNAPAELTATVLERHTSEQTFLLTAGSDTIAVRTQMIGTHHVYNCLTAAAIGLTCGLDLPAVARGLEAVEYVPGRLDRIECGQPFSVFIDFAHTPDALSASLKTLREVIAGRLICVFGAGGDRDRQKRPLMAQAVQAEADLTVLTSDNPRSEDPCAILADLLEGFRQPADAKVLPDRAEAVRWALSEARAGDCVLIAGKGHERFQIVGDRQIPLDDRQIATEWLYANQPDAVCDRGETPRNRRR